MSEINNQKNVNKREIKKEGFFKNVIKSIKDFDKYEDFGLEGISKTAIYLIKIVAIFTLVITIMTIYNLSNTLNDVFLYFDENIRTLSYTDGILEINSNEKLEIINENSIINKIIIDTDELTEEQINTYRDTIKNEKNGIILLKDKILLKNEMLSAITESSYKDLLGNYNINNMDKQMILDYFNSNQFQIYVSMFLIIFIYMFAIYIASVFVDSLVLGVLAFLTARIAGMRIRFGAAFSMGVHALTLPIILNIIYTILNGLTGYIIPQFQFMYTAISYIYIIAAIFIIKSDYIKRQAEVEKIKSEQEKIREEMNAQKQKEQDEEAKRKEEQEKQEQKEKEAKDKKGNKKEKGKGSIPKTGESPQGSSV